MLWLVDSDRPMKIWVTEFPPRWLAGALRSIYTPEKIIIVFFLIERTDEASMKHNFKSCWTASRGTAQPRILLPSWLFARRPRLNPKSWFCHRLVISNLRSDNNHLQCKLTVVVSETAINLETHLYLRWHSPGVGKITVSTRDNWGMTGLHDLAAHFWLVYSPPDVIEALATSVVAMCFTSIWTFVVCPSHEWRTSRVGLSKAHVGFRGNHLLGYAFIT